MHQVVLNSKKQNGWEKELRTSLPTFENGKVFRVDVKCLDGEFEFLYNGDVSNLIWLVTQITVTACIFIGTLIHWISGPSFNLSSFTSPFYIQVLILTIFFQVLGVRFPYRDGFALEDVKFVWLIGGSNGMVWTGLALPGGNFKLGQLRDMYFNFTKSFPLSHIFSPHHCNQQSWSKKLYCKCIYFYAYHHSQLCVWIRCHLLMFNQVKEHS